jgi:hypothetical protein
MSEGEGDVVNREASVGAVSSVAAGGNVTVGDQSLAYADVQIRVEAAAHQRRVEQQRLDHDLAEEAKDNTWRRVRENITFGVVIIVVVGVFVGTVYVALTTNDPIRQTFAQGLATTIGGAIGGAFAGYVVGERRK